MGHWRFILDLDYEWQIETMLNKSRRRARKSRTLQKQNTSKTMFSTFVRSTPNDRKKVFPVLRSCMFPSKRIIFLRNQSRKVIGFLASLALWNLCWCFYIINHFEMENVFDRNCTTLWSELLPPCDNISDKMCSQIQRFFFNPF